VTLRTTSDACGARHAGERGTPKVRCRAGVVGDVKLWRRVVRGGHVVAQIRWRQLPAQSSRCQGWGSRGRLSGGQETEDESVEYNPPTSFTPFIRKTKQKEYDAANFFQSLKP